ncbi:MAG: Rossman fold protein, TIGR00730 family [Candidatus Taylorbacteria bacterium RIFOXYD2_FULL_36_9]|uniref:Cytokinin riboside 5'-monophosphate phosphoribohydrolase n=1 Tax=Candidatus Taylorbacteria bacterium RIFOXYD2_FULL_36_9 TaxID=1802338 RepID=A0A1G2PC61_9BACT|nr:MAG: Rossman fold protein, TIGR00730 family [Candidatus Taylorbacteria bacterium RIFOXYD2_FULL_36_9]
MNIKNLFLKKDRKPGEPLTIKEMERLIKNRMNVTNKEFEAGYNLIKKYPRSVSILGSARFTSDNIYYKQAESLGKRIVKELNYTVVTGGGPGIMEAANKGAYEAGGKSLGFAIKLPKEQIVNKYLTEYVEFEYFFSRKTLLFFSAETYVYYPGGFGTMDELFEILTLIQTGEIPRVPVILVGHEFWQPLLDLIKEELLEDEQTIDLQDTNIYKIVDSEDEILSIIKNAPFRQE